MNLVIMGVVHLFSARPDADRTQPPSAHRRVEGFDYELMARIHARNPAKRARYGKHTYDPETWLPVPEKKPEHPRRARRDDGSLGAARMHRAACAARVVIPAVAIHCGGFIRRHSAIPAVRGLT